MFQGLIVRHYFLNIKPLFKYAFNTTLFVAAGSFNRLFAEIFLKKKNNVKNLGLILLSTKIAET